jgi:hypothetical protein
MKKFKIGDEVHVTINKVKHYGKIEEVGPDDTYRIRRDDGVLSQNLYGADRISTTYFKEGSGGPMPHSWIDDRLRNY